MSVRIRLPGTFHYLVRVIHDPSLRTSGESPDAGTILDSATGIIVTVASATGDD